MFNPFIFKVITDMYVPIGHPQVAQRVENLPAMRDLSSIPGSGRFPGEGNGYPLQYSCLGNPMDRKSLGQLQSTGSQNVRNDWVTNTHTHKHLRQWRRSPRVDGAARVVQKRKDWSPLEKQERLPERLDVGLEACSQPKPPHARKEQQSSTEKPKSRYWSSRLMWVQYSYC